MLTPHIAIRSYTKRSNKHSHPFYQLVLPLRGAITIKMTSYQGLVGPGDCVIIKPDEIHTFSADEQAKFVVVDSETLPEQLLNSEYSKVSIPPPSFQYLVFIEQQLMHQANSLTTQVIDLLFQLLNQQISFPKGDDRIQRVLEYIDLHLSQELTIPDLAKKAYLSETQFKKLFKSTTGMACNEFVTKQRMEKAKAMLIHSDMPINIIAELVGYKSQSAFTRKFKQYYGMTPNQLARSS